MAGKGFVHVNGTTYETSDVWDQHSAEELVNRLLNGVGPTQTFAVLVEGVRMDLTVITSGVWAAGAWHDENPSI
jgi:hypothetical protein